ncbi:MAG TPA: hypothetical protein VGL93_16480 [Streptosporangiaceae bacterium]|jgi:hypothetical protein
MYRTSPEFRKNSDNLRAVRKELVQIERAHKRAIRESDGPAIGAFARLHGLLIGIFAENMLRKIASDPNGFNDRERELLRRAGSQNQKWLDAVELATRRHYGVLFHIPLSERSLGQPTYARYGEICRLLTVDLQSLISDRNKTAHGQWVWHFRDRNERAFKQDSAPDPENYWKLYQKSKMIATIGSIVYLLAVSEPTFDREYTMLIDDLEGARCAIQDTSYESFAAQLKATRPRANGA